jgi:acetyl esterase/lipase
MKYISLLVFLALACQKEESPGATGPETPHVAMNVSYGADPLQKMDIYLPGGRSTTATKTMVLIHGGAWAGGDKSDFNQYVDTLKKRLPGYAIFNINYRLSTGSVNPFPTQENDVKAAIEFIHSKQNEYFISNNFVLLGASAGGHLALLQGYKHTTPANIRAIVSFFGPTDMVDLYNNPASPIISSATIAQIVGATPASNPTVYQESSPINFVTGQSPPTILLHGGLDPLVRPFQSEILKAKLELMNVPVEYLFYPAEAHGWIGANIKHSFEHIQAFLELHVN